MSPTAPVSAGYPTDPNADYYAQYAAYYGQQQYDYSAAYAQPATEAGVEGETTEQFYARMEQTYGKEYADQLRQYYAQAGQYAEEQIDPNAPANL